MGPIFVNIFLLFSAALSSIIQICRFKPVQWKIAATNSAVIDTSWKTYRRNNLHLHDKCTPFASIYLRTGDGNSSLRNCWQSNLAAAFVSVRWIQVISSIWKSRVGIRITNHKSCFTRNVKSWWTLCNSYKGKTIK